MYTLAPDEKTAAVMIYTQDAMLHCEAVVKSALSRISTWLRTQSAPEYLHLINLQMLGFSSGTIQRVQYPECYLPIQQVVAYHLAGAQEEPLDYEPGEVNRLAQSVSLHIGTFVFKGTLRLAPNSTVGSQMEASRSPWVSVYDLTVSNPNIPNLQYRAPMALFNPTKVLYGIS